MTRSRRILGVTAVGAVVLSLTISAPANAAPFHDAERSNTTTPISHLVVIFQENVTFHHYFATYPQAANPAGEPRFSARGDTPTVNGLAGPLLTSNPNLSNPQRLGRAEAVTCDQNHDYTAEQAAYDHGAMDKFVENTSSQTGTPAHPQTRGECLGKAATPSDYAVMDYYDGNTVTGLWNYAQHFAMSDNSFSGGFGPSTPGAFQVIAGTAGGAICAKATSSINAAACPTTVVTSPPAGVQPQGSGTVFGDPDPLYDVCSNPSRGDGLAAMGGHNVGDLLSAGQQTWGWFQGGFASPGYVPGQPATDDLTKVCTGTHLNIAGAKIKDYSAHHAPFQYWPQSANPRHLPPLSVAAIGHDDQANHQYDLSDFWAAAGNGGLPGVSYLKAAEYQDGHAGYSDPRDEQRFLADTINGLQRLPDWKSTAVVVLYDDSDGWYDHVMGPVLRQSQSSIDVLTGPGQCGAGLNAVPRSENGTPQQGRCGLGPRQPLLAISPYSRQNFVDHSLTEQASVVRFIEDNWKLAGVGGGSGDRGAGSLTGLFDFRGDGEAGRLILDPATGQPAGS